MTVTLTFTRDAGFPDACTPAWQDVRFAWQEATAHTLLASTAVAPGGVEINAIHGVRRATGARAWQGESLEPADPWSVHGRRVGQARQADDRGAEGDHLGLGERPPLPRPLVRIRALQHACADSGRAGAGVCPDT